MVKPAARWVDKYGRRTAVATPDYQWGVQNPSRDPTAAAISMKETLKAKMADAKTWDKWEEALKAVGMGKWQEAALNKGASRYGPGVEFGKKYYSDFASKFEAHLAAGVAEVYKLPKVTIEDSINRAATMIRHNAKFRYKK